MKGTRIMSKITIGQIIDIIAAIICIYNCMKEISQNCKSILESLKKELLEELQQDRREQEQEEQNHKTENYR